MNKVKTLDDLKRLREELQTKVNLRVKGENAEKLVQIKVAMATCGIASGAREIMDFMITELDKRNINAVVTQTGCMGYCYAEPTIEVSLPGNEPLIFGNVNKEKADEIIEKYIKNGILVDGIIPVTHKTIDAEKK
jgi:NADP-reducing hydrogenase subunit HndB